MPSCIVKYLPNSKAKASRFLQRADSWSVSQGDAIDGCAIPHAGSNRVAGKKKQNDWILIEETSRSYQSVE